MHSTNCGNQYHSSPKSNRKRTLFIIIVAILLTAFTLCALYFVVAQPILAKYVYKNNAIHEGIPYYENGSYLDFESGDRFGVFLFENKIVSSSQPVGFYHIDNKVRDNPFYGKQCDVFSLDIVVAEEQFLEEKSKILGNYSENLWNEGDFVVYIAEDKTHENGDILMIAFSDEHALIRYILITDLDPYEGTDDQYSKGIKYARVVRNNSGMHWEIM